MKGINSSDENCLPQRAWKRYVFGGTCANFGTCVLLGALLAFSNLFPAFAQPGNAARELQQTFIQTAKTIKPSVVHIRVEKRIEEAAGQFNDPFHGGPDDSPFGDLFKKFFKNHPNLRKMRPPRQQEEGTGSGVIVESDGTILTNNHVVKGSTTLTVKLHDGREFKAKVIGQDPQSDLAVIKIECPTPLPKVKFADSTAVEPGQWCMAIGNPLGLEETITVGVVSAVGRSGIGASPIEDFIQTDCSINPGNSGGPLVDLDGNVIGINTLVFAAPGAGIGFSIPSSMAQRVTSQIVSKGSVERPFLGITMQPVTPDLADHYNLKDRSGAVVLDMTSGSPAEKAGFRQMDIILSINGKSMKDTSDVQKTVLSKSVGDQLEVKVLRSGEEKTLTVHLERMPKTFGLRDPEDLRESENHPGQEKEKSGDAKNLGFSYQVLTPEMAKSLNIDSKRKGLVVTDVEENSTAEKGGLQVQDVITQVNGQAVNGEAEMTFALKAVVPGKKSSVFVVIREGNPLFLVIPEETSKK